MFQAAAHSSSFIQCRVIGSFDHPAKGVSSLLPNRLKLGPSCCYLVQRYQGSIQLRSTRHMPACTLSRPCLASTQLPPCS